MTDLVYKYDGSWAGMLSVIFDVFDRKEQPVRIFSGNGQHTGFFDQVHEVATDIERAKRVASGIKKKSKKTFKRIYRCFLSEKEDREMVCLKVAQLVFKHANRAENDYGNPYVLRIKQIEKEMSREVHRMHAFVRFQKAKDDIWYALVAPDFDVMPLIGLHFEKRYADQKWIIYDLKRDYGLYYDLKKTDFIEVNFKDRFADGRLPEEALSASELNYQELWKDYFDFVNIKERKNMKLHIQHVPKRYWGLLTEKY